MRWNRPLAMSRILIRIFALVFTGLLASACDQGRDNPPDVNVLVANAVPTQEAITFRREEFGEPVTLAYRNSAAFSYDEDQYDFHVEVTRPGATTPTRLASFSEELSANNDYMFVVMDVGGTIQHATLAFPKLAAGGSEARFAAVHAGPGVQALDIYLERPGTSIATVSPRGTLSFGAALSPGTLAAGDYELTATAAGDPANVLLTSPVFTLAAAAPVGFAIVADAEEGVVPFRVLVLRDAPSVLIDRNAQAGLRVLNGASDQGARDVAINGQFAPPQFASVPFASLSAYSLVPASELTVNVTPPGNPGVLELTQTITPAAAAKHTLIVTGDAGTLTHVIISDDGRRIPDQARLTLYNVARQFTQLDYFVVPPGTDITTVFPIASLTAPGVSTLFSIAAGTYDLVLRQNGTTNIVAGPTPITVAGGGIYGVLAVNGADTATANVVYLEDFP
jgi:hypothetical protein